jgi:hypothetical protein
MTKNLLGFTILMVVGIAMGQYTGHYHGRDYLADINPQISGFNQARDIKLADISHPLANKHIVNMTNIKATLIGIDDSAVAVKIDPDLQELTWSNLSITYKATAEFVDKLRLGQKNGNVTIIFATSIIETKTKITISSKGGPQFDNTHLNIFYPQNITYVMLPRDLNVEADVNETITSEFSAKFRDAIAANLTAYINAYFQRAVDQYEYVQNYTSGGTIVKWNNTITSMIWDSDGISIYEDGSILTGKEVPSKVSKPATKILGFEPNRGSYQKVWTTEYLTGFMQTPASQYFLWNFNSSNLPLYKMDYRIQDIWAVYPDSHSSQPDPTAEINVACTFDSHEALGLFLCPYRQRILVNATLDCIVEPNGLVGFKVPLQFRFLPQVGLSGTKLTYDGFITRGDYQITTSFNNGPRQQGLLEEIATEGILAYGASFVEWGTNLVNIPIQDGRFLIQDGNLLVYGTQIIG